jgi:hypothetical protein
VNLSFFHHGDCCFPEVVRWRRAPPNLYTQIAGLPFRRIPRLMALGEIGYIGVDIPGCYAEYVAIPAKNAWKNRDTLPLDWTPLQAA